MKSTTAFDDQFIAGEDLAAGDLVIRTPEGVLVKGKLHVKPPAPPAPPPKTYGVFAGDPNVGKIPAVPADCRQRLCKEGKPYPRSSCAVCGQFSPRHRQCDAMLQSAVEPPSSPWKDIVDAPKDGTEILMLRPSGKRIVVWWHAGGWKSSDGVGHLALTPHAKWMHLPEATS